MKWVYLISGGILGTMGRYLLSGAVQRWFGSDRFPLGTFAVNILGCLVIGILAGVAERRGALTPDFRLFWMTGFLGAFTTFSAFIYESSFLLNHHQVGLAALNLVGSLAAGLAAFWIGLRLAAIW